MKLVISVKFGLFFKAILLIIFLNKVTCEAPIVGLARCVHLYCTLLYWPLKNIHIIKFYKAS